MTVAGTAHVAGRRVGKVWRREGHVGRFWRVHRLCGDRCFGVGETCVLGRLRYEGKGAILSVRRTTVRHGRLLRTATRVVGGVGGTRLHIRLELDSLGEVGRIGASGSKRWTHCLTRWRLWLTRVMVEEVLLLRSSGGLHAVLGMWAGAEVCVVVRRTSV